MLFIKFFRWLKISQLPITILFLSKSLYRLHCNQKQFNFYNNNNNNKRQFIHAHQNLHQCEISI